MDDNKTNPPQNQSIEASDPNYTQSQGPTPLYETVPEENLQQSAPQPLQPEEVPSSTTTPEDAYNTEAPVAVSGDDEPPPIYEESKTKYFIIGGGVLFFLVLFVILLSVFLGGKKNNKPVTLTYWMLWEDAATFDPIIKEYQRKNPNVTIKVQKMTIDDYREKLSAQIPDGRGPDLFRFHNTWLPELRDIVSPLPTSIMSHQEFEKTFYPVQSKDLCMNSDNSLCDVNVANRKKYAYYGIPLEIDGLVLLYNADLFNKASIEKPPNNLDELIDTNFLSKFTFKDTDGKLRSSAIAMGTTSNVEHFSDIFGLLLLQNGGDLKKLDDPTAAGALEGYRKFAEVGVWDDTMPNSIAAFTQEKVAMIIVPSWEILSIHAQNPDLKFKVAPIPFNLPGNQSVSLATYWAEGVSKKSPNPLEAWKFLKFLSEKDTMTKLYAEEKKTRLFGEPYSRVDLSDKLISDEYVGVVIQQAENYSSMPIISRTYDKGLNDSIVKYIENAINATEQGVKYEEALAPAKQGINQLFTQYKIQ